MRDYDGPGRRGQDYAYDDYGPSYNGRPPAESYHPRYNYDSYDSRPPPPSDRYYDAYDSRQPAMSSYHPQPPPRNDRPYDYGRPRDAREHEYTFRGAASGASSRPQEQFTFRAPGPNLPGNLTADHWGPAVPHKMQRQRDGGRIPGAHERRDRGPADGSRGGRMPDRGRGRGRGGFRGFGPRPAHNRDILSAVGRETTPEQMEGMNGGEARFRAISSSSEGDDSSDDEPGDGPSRKRTKIAGDAETSAPKWSNPDIYHLAPVPAENETAKRDLVEEIRKAKAEPVNGTQARNDVAENADFISFGDDMDDDSAKSTPSSTATAARSGAPSFSHRSNLHGKTGPSHVDSSSDRARSSFTPINGHAGGNDPHAPGSTEHGGPPPRALDAMQPRDSNEAPLRSTTSLNNRKRKFRQQAALGDIVEEWEALEGQDPTPWCTGDHSDTAMPSHRLHLEIREYFDFMSPRDFEKDAREDLIDRLEKAVRQWSGGVGLYMNARIICFGSFASGLYLPTADMDVVAISQQYQQSGLPSLGTSSNQLHKLAAYFTKCGIAKERSTTVVGKAKVPLVKFVDKLTGLKVDLSFENESGYLALDTFKTWKSQFPDMPVLVAVVKQLLAMRGLNEVFNGGIGGFTTICLVVHLLQTLPEMQCGAMESNQHYGDLLMRFLDLYGNKFSYTEVGITMHRPYEFNKISDRVAAKINPNRLSIIDPNRSNNDIAGGSHHIDAVFDCFRHAYNDLQRELVKVKTGSINVKSILDCVLGGNYDSVVRQRRRLKDLFGGRVAAGSTVLPTPPPAASAPQQPRPRPDTGRDFPRGGGRHNQSGPAGQQAPGRNNVKKGTQLQPPKLEIPPGSTKQEEQKLKTLHGKRKRAYDFKKKHPNAPNVPDMLSRGEQRRLLDQITPGNKKK